MLTVAYKNDYVIYILEGYVQKLVAQPNSTLTINKCGTGIFCTKNFIYEI